MVLAGKISFEKNDAFHPSTLPIAALEAGWRPRTKGRLEYPTHNFQINLIAPNYKIKD
jgi:hypothetical protein